MHLHCNFDTPIQLTNDPEDYVRPMEITVIEFGERGAAHMIGKLAVDQVLWADAEARGVPLSAVCDQDSQGLQEVYTILTKCRERFRPDLEIDEFTHQMMFVNRFVLHPLFRPFSQAILNAALKIWGELTLGAMWRDTSDLSEKQLADLGFRKITRSRLIFRHLSLRTPFDDAREHRDSDELEPVKPTREHEAWVLREWGVESDSEIEPPRP